MKRIDIIIVTLLITCMGASAALINGDMSGPPISVNNPMDTNQVNQGWQTFSSATWSNSSGLMIRGGNQINNDQRGFGQLFTDPTLVGVGDLSFDLVVINDTNQYPLMNWWLVGYTVTNNPVNFDTTEDININLIDQNRPLNGANYSVTYLTEEWDWQAGPNGAGSVTTNITRSIDFGTGYDYFAFAFSANAGDYPADYIHVDNVSVVIPEPASFGLLLLGLAGLRMYRRMKRL